MKQQSKIILAFLMIVSWSLWFQWDLYGRYLALADTFDQKIRSGRARSTSVFPIFMFGQVF